MKKILLLLLVSFVFFSCKNDTINAQSSLLGNWILVKKNNFLPADGTGPVEAINPAEYQKTLTINQDSTYSMVEKVTNNGHVSTNISQGKVVFDSKLNQLHLVNSQSNWFWEVAYYTPQTLQLELATWGGTAIEVYNASK